MQKIARAIHLYKSIHTMQFTSTHIMSPIGELIAVATESHLVILEFSDSKGLEKKLSIHRKYEESLPKNTEHAILKQTRIQL